MKKPKLNEIVQIMQTGKDFSLTETQYLQTTGANIPKENYYLIHKSAISKRAKEMGYTIGLSEKTINFKKEK